MTSVKSLRKGSYFTLKDVSEPKESQVWVRGLYDPSVKAYECFRFDDISYTRYFKGSRLVFVDFVF